MSALPKHWRVLVLVVLLVGSGATVFGLTPNSSTGGAGDAPAAANGPTLNLNFGLELDGGTRIRAPLVGVKAEGVNLSTSVNPTELERDIAENIDTVGPSDVTVYPRYDVRGRDAGAIEVTASGVSTDELASALDEEGIAYERARDGVTRETRKQAVDVINNKINEAGLSGGSARSVNAGGGNYFILVEVPSERRGEVKQLLQERGKVQIDIYYPTTGENGTRTYETREAVLEQSDFQRIGTATSDNRLGPHVPVVLKQGAAERFANATIETGVTDGNSCTYDTNPESTDPCLLTKVDGKVVYSAGMAPSLGNSIESGEWLETTNFVLQTENRSEAASLALHLRAGALPTELDLENGTTTYISPTQGDHFKVSGLIIGLLAILAVALKVFMRYRDIRVVLPMMATALSEVVILLGLASVISYPIDLAVIGGFIAVVGTGVDDLIIITNEVLQEGDVNSSRVFDSRFSKAFWVIGAAALTAIVAMGPLVVLPLGALRGFAIFTIIGVLIGVGITRPAYGDILRYLLIEDDD